MGRTTLAIMRGAPDAEAEAFATFELGTAAGQPDVAEAFGAQIYVLRHYQGRLAELVGSAEAEQLGMAREIVRFERLQDRL